MRVAPVLVVCLLAGTAGAQTKQPSKEYLALYQAGIDAFRLAKYDEARQDFEAAKAIDKTLPGPWRWLAAVDEVEKKYADCEASAREAVRLNPASDTVADTIKLHDQCRNEWGRPAFDTKTLAQGQGAIAITCDQNGATVSINGLASGATPAPPRAVVAGDVDVKLEKDGFLPAEVKTTVVAGLVTDVDVTMEVDPNAHASTLVVHAEDNIGWVKVTSEANATIQIDGAAGKLDAQGRFEVSPGEHEIEISAPGHEGTIKKVHVTKGQMISVDAPLRDVGGLDRQRKMGTIAVGAGVGLLAVGAVTALLSLHASDQARDEWTTETTRPTTIPLSDSQMVAPLHTRADIDALDSKAKTFGIVSDASYAIAAVAVAIGAYYLVHARPSVEVRW